VLLFLFRFPTRRSSDLTLRAGIASRSTRKLEPISPRWMTRSKLFSLTGTLRKSCLYSVRLDHTMRGTPYALAACSSPRYGQVPRSEEHTSELQSRENLV